MIAQRNQMLHRGTRNVLNCRYQPQLIQSKGALLLILWGFLLHFSSPDLTVYIAGFSDNDNNNLYFSNIPLFIFYLSFPLIGLFTDIRIGRYRASVITCTSALIACLVIFVGVSLTEFIPNNKSIGYAFLYTGIPLYLIMKRCFQIVTLCFALDQLMDAPSSEISAFIHWKYFVSILTWMVDVVLTCAL